MSRVIKFRAWDGEKMLPQEALFWNGERFVTGVWVYEGTHIDPYTESNIELMQYTGLKDTNGKEIYEGDIFTANRYPFYSDDLLNYVGQIIYDDRSGYMGWFYDLHRVSYRVRGGACGSGLADLENFELTVIGNIYENPELLEQVNG